MLGGGRGGGAIRECRGRLTHSNWAPAATNNDVPRCAHHFRKGGGETELLGTCGGSRTTTTPLPTKFPHQPSVRKLE